MKLSKKIISFVLATLMAVSMMPITAFAWDNALTYVKKDTPWNDYEGKYAAYLHNGSKNDYVGIVLKEVNSNGEITVEKGENFSITLSCGTWTATTANNGTLQTNDLSWHYGNSDKYALASADGKNGKNDWYAYLSTDVNKDISASRSGNLPNNSTRDDLRARASDGGTNEAYGVWNFTPTSFEQLNTVGDYTIYLAPTICMNQWKYNWGNSWNAIYGWGRFDYNRNDIANRTIPVTVHVVCSHKNGSQSANNGYAATCTRDGKESDLVCKDCGETTATGSVLTAPGHNLVNVDAKESTCFAKGNTAGQKCTNCEYTTVTETEMKAHSYGAYTKTDANNCIRFCTTDGCTAYESTPHTWDAGEVTDATCTDAGNTHYTCTTCGQAKDVAITAKGHTPVTDAKVEATCTTTGLTEGSHCSVCNAVLVAQTVVEKKEHTPVTDAAVEATCTTTGLTEGSHCSVCNAVLVAQSEVAVKAHTPVSANNAVAPQVGVAGKEADTICDVCGELLEEGAEIPALTGPDNTANLTLESEISFNLSIDTNYYLENEFAEGTTADEVEYVVEYKQQTVQVGQPADGVAINAAVEAVVADGKTLIKVETAPAQLTEEISVVLKAKDDSKSVTVLDGYSMKDYCNAVISRNGQSKAVCEELIRYAATAQVNFNYNPENMAVEVDDAFVSQLNADYTALGAYNTPAAVSNDINVAITGVSYVALSDATVRFYLDKTMTEFYAANGCTYGECELTMTMDDQTGTKVYTPYFAMAEGSDEVYIAVPGIESANLDNTFHITMTTKSGKTMTIDYAATTFCKSAVANAKTDELKNLAKSIVLYNDAANKRFV